jgi:WD40 repeat protein/serine/threonine protein kinase
MSEGRLGPDLQEDKLPRPTSGQKTELRDQQTELKEQPPTSDLGSLTSDRSQQSTCDPLPPPEPNSVPLLHLAEEAYLSRAFADKSPPTIPGYEILGELGHGGMGVVYQARQVSLGRIVALKMIRSVELASGEDFLRFRSEAEMVARLRHPNIVTIHEIGVHDGRPYFSLEYVEGGTLAQRIRGIPQSPRAAAEMAEILAGAVHAAHQRGIIHRDLKPANILLQRKHELPNSKSQDNEPRMKHGLNTDSVPCSIRVPSVAAISDFEPKISDFGLAKRLDSLLTTQASPGTPQALLTQTGAVMGTPSYMAPEQAAGKSKEIGPAADIYSLGAILYELCTGRPPFLAESWDATRDLVLSQEPLPPRRLQPKLPRDLQTICLKCLEKEPRKRFASAQELADELRRFLDGKPIRSRPVSTVERVWRWTRRNPKLALASNIAAAALIAAVIGFASLMLYRSRTSREAQLKAAEKALDQGLVLCEKGEVAQGMLLLARSLELAPEDAEDLEQAIRINLTGWRQQVHSLKEVLPHQGKVLAVGFSADGNTIWTASAGGTAQSWDANNGKPIVSTVSIQKDVSAVAFSADCEILATGSTNGAVHLWNTSSAMAICQPLVHSSPVTSLAFSPRGEKLLTGCSDGSVQLWETATGKVLGEPMLNSGLVDAVAFTPDGSRVLTASSNSAQLWDALTGKRLSPPPLQHANGVQAVAFSLDGKTIVTGSRDKTCRIWEAASRNPVGHPLPQQNQVLAVAITPDGKRVLTGSADHSARLWEIASWDMGHPPLWHENVVWSIAFSSDGTTILSGSADNTAQLWDATTGKRLHTLPHEDWVHVVAFNPVGKSVATGSADGTGRLWDVSTGRCLALLQHGARVWDLAFSPDGKTIVTASTDSTAQLWSTATGAPIGPRLQHGAEVKCVAFSPLGKIVLTGSADGTARLWDAATGDALHPLFRHDHWVSAVAFSPDGKTVLTGSTDHTGRLWDVETGERRNPPLVHQGPIYAVALSPDGRTAVTGSEDNTARLWDTATGVQLATLKHQGEVRSVAFSPDGKMVLTGSYDSTGRLWQTALGKGLGPPLSHRGRVYVVVFSQDGKTVLTGSLDQTVRRWEVPEAMEGTAQRIVLWTQAITGMELESGGAANVMDSERWHQRCQLLEELGGAPNLR